VTVQERSAESDRTRMQCWEVTVQECRARTGDERNAGAGQECNADRTRVYRWERTRESTTGTGQEPSAGQDKNVMLG
jgi:hypothetical protein